MKKMRHVCFSVGLFVSIVYGFIYAPKLGLYLAVALALLREYDTQHRYSAFDWRDTATTCFGGLIGFIVILILNIFLYTVSP